MAQPPSGMDRGRPYSAGSSAPVDPVHVTTSFLDPAAGTIHNHDLFFISKPTPPMNPSPGPQSPPPANPLYPYHQQAFQYSPQAQSGPSQVPPQHQNGQYPGQFPPHRISTNFQAPPPVPPKSTGQYHPAHHAATLPPGAYNPQLQRPAYQRPGPNGYYPPQGLPPGAMAHPPQSSPSPQFSHHPSVSVGYFQQHPHGQHFQQQHGPGSPATPPQRHQSLQAHHLHHPSPPGPAQAYQRPYGMGSPQTPYQVVPFANPSDGQPPREAMSPAPYQNPPPQPMYQVQAQPGLLPSPYQPLPPVTEQPQTQPNPPVQATPPPPAPVPEEDDSDELAMVLALSQSEETKRNQMQEELQKQEEEDFARALAESLRQSSLPGGMTPAPNNPFLEENIASSSRILVEHLPRPESPKVASPSTPTPAHVDVPSSEPGPSSAPSPSSSTLPPSSTPSFVFPPSSSSSFTDEPDSIDVFKPDQPMPSFALGRYDKGRIPSLPPDLPPTEHLSVREGKRPERPELMDGSDDVLRRSPSPIGSDTELAYMRDDDDEDQAGLEPEPVNVRETQVDVKGKRSASFGTPEKQLSLPVYEEEEKYPPSPGVAPLRSDSPSESSDWHASTNFDHDQVLLPTNATLVFDDEAYARRLAAEEGEAQAELYKNIGRSNKEREAGFGLDPSLPSYSTIIRSPEEPRPPLDHSASDPGPQDHSPLSAQPSISPHPLLPPIVETSETPLIPSDYLLNSALSASPPPPPAPTQADTRASSFGYTSSPVVYPTVGGHRQSFSGPSIPEAPPASPPQPPVPNNNAAPAVNRTSVYVETRPPLPASTSDPGPAASPPSSTVNHYNRVSVSSSSSAGVNANTYISRQLLLGVSIGFDPPKLTKELYPMESPMPNIITLPYSRCPPLHFQAPDWRHMLQLMARLSGTRLEPTVETMAVSKTDLKLRIVVQFVKPHPALDQWRTILWFTVDHPIPRQAPGAAKYLAHNPNMLPWSYTQPMMSIPKILKDGDSAWSKVYTIPPSDAVPLPNLPVSFTNLALYLQAALDHSRRVGSSGDIGKLGKMVKTCYPTVEIDEPAFDIQNADKTKRTHLFKRVIGKATGKGSKKDKGTQNNETYQLVTPFVPDEWG